MDTLLIGLVGLVVGTSGLAIRRLEAAWRSAFPRRRLQRI
jgi:hypothetical protein